MSLRWRRPQSGRRVIPSALLAAKIKEHESAPSQEQQRPQSANSYHRHRVQPDSTSTSAHIHQGSSNKHHQHRHNPSKQAPAAAASAKEKETPSTVEGTDGTLTTHHDSSSDDEVIFTSQSKKAHRGASSTPASKHQRPRSADPSRRTRHYARPTYTTTYNVKPASSHQQQQRRSHSASNRNRERPKSAGAMPRYSRPTASQAYAYQRTWVQRNHASPHQSSSQHRPRERPGSRSSTPSSSSNKPTSSSGSAQSHTPSSLNVTSSMSATQQATHAQHQRQQRHHPHTSSSHGNGQPPAVVHITATSMRPSTPTQSHATRPADPTPAAHSSPRKHAPIPFKPIEAPPPESEQLSKSAQTTVATGQAAEPPPSSSSVAKPPLQPKVVKVEPTSSSACCDSNSLMHSIAACKPVTSLSSTALHSSTALNNTSLTLNGSLSGSTTLAQTSTTQQQQQQQQQQQAMMDPSTAVNAVTVKYANPASNSNPPSGVAMKRDRPTTAGLDRPVTSSGNKPQQQQQQRGSAVAASVNVANSAAMEGSVSLEERVRIAQVLIQEEKEARRQSSGVGGRNTKCTSDFYTFGKVVGVGSFAKVRIAKHKLTGQSVAIKTYEKNKIKDANAWKRIQQEVKLMEKLDHPLVIRMFETIESPRRIHIVMEFLSGTNLCSHVKSRKKLPEPEARKIMAHLTVALEYMHDLHVAHRDIKLENVLFDESWNAKLIDFGFSVSCKDKKLKVFCGTPSYMAPEIVKRSEYKGKPTDVWSLGIVLFAMISGCFPFSAKTYPDLYKKILRGHFRFPDNVFSEGAKDLISRMLNSDINQRLTIAEVRNHAWLKPAIPTTAQLLNSPAGQVCVSQDSRKDLYPAALQRTEMLGIDRQRITEDVLAKLRNGLTTCYYLTMASLKLRQQQPPPARN